MQPASLEIAAAIALCRLHRYGVTFTVSGDELELLATRRITLPEQLRDAMRVIKPVVIKLQADWPTTQRPGPCPLCGCPSFHVGDVGILLCRSYQPMGDADESQLIQVVTNSDGAACEQTH
jgi:hypothetical protein